MSEAGHRFDPSILREYDIRGVVGETLSRSDAVAVGRTLAAIARERDAGFVCVGRDGRVSSPELEDGVVEGIVRSGLIALRIGLCATPNLYFASRILDAGAAVMVTGSHNPAEYNGFKILLANAAMWGEEIQAFGARAARGEWVEGQGRIVELDLLDAYVTRLLLDYRTEEGLKVVWDAGNGAAGPAVERLARRLPGEHVVLNEAVDGRFPAHHPDPTVVENLEQLRQAVRGMGCDLGVAFDGDGDRIGAVDGEGRILWGDQLLTIFARDLLRRRPGATVIADVKASQTLFDEVDRCGGTPVMCGTGHSVIKARMAELGAELAGEMSGHMFFADRYYGFDDALYAAVRLLDIVARGNGSLAALVDTLPRVVNTPEIRIEVPEARKFAIVDEVKARLATCGAEVTDIDGVRVREDGGWWLLRASNTQNALVIRCEAETEAALARLKARVGEELRASGIENLPL